MARTAHRSLWRLLHWLFGLAFALLVVAAILLCGLAWRLSSRPLDITDLAQRATARWRPAWPPIT